MRKIPYSTLLLMAALAAAQVSKPFVASFENREAGPYTEAMAKEDFTQYNSSAMSNHGTANSWYKVPSGRAEIVDEDGGKALRVKYPAGCVGTTEPNDCAIQIRWAFHKDEVADSMWASYRVKFEEGFEFVRGGKLPGLCGGHCYTGCNESPGDGWSARIMWRADGNIVQYMYFSDKVDNCGDDMKWNLAGEQKKFEIGKWHKVATQVILNAVPGEAAQGEKNGIVRSWLDGEKALEVDTIRFVDFAEQKINRFYFSTFHGGSDKTWAPSKDVYALYGDFRISITPPEYLDSQEEEKPGQTPISPKKPAEGMGVKFTGGALHFSQALQEQATFKLIDLKGNLAWKSVLMPGQSYLKPPALSRGVYIWQLKGKGINFSAQTLL